jgi:hypothetical protein
LEGIGIVIYFINYKAFFYTDDNKSIQPQTVREAMEFSLEKETGQLTEKRFHPFFVYTHKAGTANTNNYGFYCPFDYPLKRENADWFIIGIFGGSVANDFYTEGKERLTERLKADPYFADREIVYLNYALGGYKQPQQVQILTYFLSIGQELDMAINIDGFNELVFCANNNRLNVDIGMPSAQHFLPMRDLVDRQVMNEKKLERIWNIRKYKNDFIRIDGKAAKTKLASLHLIYSSYATYLYKKYRSEIVKFDSMIEAAKPGDSIINIASIPHAADEPVLLAQTASLWYRASVNMNSVVKGLGGRYFHFLQPNQYFCRKEFTKEEQETALDEKSAYHLLVTHGYPVLLKAVDALRNGNVNAFNAAGIFDKVKETVFIDTCCHFNRLGNEIFADFIAESILKNIHR